MFSTGVLGGRGEARAYYMRPGYHHGIAATSKSLRRLREGGLCVIGRFGDRRSLRYCRLTSAGAVRVADLMPVDGVPFPDINETRTVSREDVSRAMALPVRLFAHEAEALAPEWKAARRAAHAQGRDYYRVWLRTWRRESGANNRLPFDDEEVLAALAKVVDENDGEPVLAAKVMDELAPGRWTHSEVARVSQALVRLRAAGKVDRADTTGKKRWTVV